MEMYELIKDANGVYEMQVKLLQNEAQILPLLVEDQKLITEYLKRQTELIEITLAKEGQNPFKGFMAGLKEAQFNLKTLGQLGADVAETSINGISDSIWDAVEGTKSLNEGLREVGKTIADMVAKQAIKNIVTMAMNAGSDGGGAVGAVISNIFGGAAGGTGGSTGPQMPSMQPGTMIAHAGGIVGKEGSKRSVLSSVFAGAVRAHNGLMPGERPIIARDDEGVFTPGQMKALGGRGGMSDELLSQILVALQDRQTLNATIVDSREVVTKDMFAGREGEAMVMRHVSRNPQNG